jgi:hypothetical protein
MADGSGEAEKQGGVTRVRVELPEINKFEFEIPKSKNFKEVADSRMEAAVEGGIRMVGNGRGAGKAGV